MWFCPTWLYILKSSQRISIISDSHFRNRSHLREASTLSAKAPTCPRALSVRADKGCRTVSRLTVLSTHLQRERERARQRKCLPLRVVCLHLFDFVFALFLLLLLLLLSFLLQQQREKSVHPFVRPPVRCGIVMIQGRQTGLRHDNR